MNPRRSPLVSLPHLLDGFIKSQGCEIRLLEFSLQQRWALIVGPHIAGHTHPEAIRHRRLYLLAENSVWLQQLVFLKTELLAKIAQCLGCEVLVDIVLRVGLIPPPLRPDSDAEPAPLDIRSLDSDRLASIDDALASIPHTLLTERLRGLFQKSAVDSGAISAERCVPQTKSGAAVYSPPTA